MLRWLPSRAREIQGIDGFSPDRSRQWARGDERAEHKRANAITNPHSPEEFRVNGLLSNMPQFAAAFARKAGQPMVRAASL
jgi:predicted metalloendopeptidase